MVILLFNALHKIRFKLPCKLMFLQVCKEIKLSIYLLHSFLLFTRHFFSFFQVTYLSLNGTISGTNYSFSPNPLYPGLNSTTLTVRHLLNLPTNVYNLTILQNSTGTFLPVTQIEVFLFSGPPSNITLTSPSPSYFETNSFTSPFSWTLQNPVQTYSCILEIASDSTFQNLLFSNQIIVNGVSSFNVLVPATIFEANNSLNFNITYYWKLASLNPCGEVNISSSFLVSSTTLQPASSTITIEEIVLIAVSSFCLVFLVIFAAIGFFISYISFKKQKSYKRSGAEAIELGNSGSGNNFYSWYLSLGVGINNFSKITNNNFSSYNIISQK